MIIAAVTVVDIDAPADSFPAYYACYRQPFGQVVLALGIWPEPVPPLSLAFQRSCELGFTASAARADAEARHTLTQRNHGRGNRTAHGCGVESSRSQADAESRAPRGATFGVETRPVNGAGNLPLWQCVRRKVYQRAHELGLRFEHPLAAGSLTHGTRQRLIDQNLSLPREVPECIRMRLRQFSVHCVFPALALAGRHSIPFTPGEGRVEKIPRQSQCVFAYAAGPRRKLLASLPVGTIGNFCLKTCAHLS